jgi:hypothetical protein
MKDMSEIWNPRSRCDIRNPQSATPLLPWLYVPAILIKAHVFTSLTSTTTITFSTFRGKVIFFSPWPAKRLLRQTVNGRYELTQSHTFGIDSEWCVNIFTTKLEWSQTKATRFQNLRVALPDMHVNIDRP